MSLTDAQDAILRNALNRLAAHVNLQIDATVLPVKANTAEEPDALIRLHWNTGECLLAAHVRPLFTRPMIDWAARKLKAFPEKGILITRYVPPGLADDLKALDIPFLDAAGNAYLHHPPLFLFLKGNKPTEAFAKEPPLRAFQTMGLKVVFALLMDPDLIRMPFRRIAMDAGVALGTVGWVMKDLQRMGFLIAAGEKGRLLVNRRQLLDRWITGYAEKLRPKMMIGRYQAGNPDWWKNQMNADPNIFWGGEVAAAKLTRYLKPRIITVYVMDTKDLGKSIIQNRLTDNAHGDVEILKVFWKCDPKRQRAPYPPRILVYADLVITGDKRNLETAEMLYEKEIARFIDED